MFSNGNVDKMEERIPSCSCPPSRIRAFWPTRGNRARASAERQASSKTQVISIRDAIFEAMLHRSPSIPRWWPSARKPGLGRSLGVYEASRRPCLPPALQHLDLRRRDRRRGGRLRVERWSSRPELMYCDFLAGRATRSSTRPASGRQCQRDPAHALVLRVSVGSKYGAQHSQDWTSVVAHMLASR